MLRCRVSALVLHEMNAVLGGDFFNPRHVGAARLGKLLGAAGKEILKAGGSGGKEHPGRCFADVLEGGNFAARDKG